MPTSLPLGVIAMQMPGSQALTASELIEERKKTAPPTNKTTQTESALPKQILACSRAFGASK